MSKTLRRARVLVALFAIAFAVFVAFAFKDRPTAPAAVSSTRLDPDAIVEGSGGTTRRLTGGREDGRLQYERLFTYADGTSRMEGVTIVSANRGGRSYTITGREARSGKGESSFTLTGDVHIVSDDGLDARAEEAIYTEASGAVFAPGAVAFTRGRLQGTGLGMTYDTRTDVLTLMAEADIHVAPDEEGASAIDVLAGRATFPRAEHLMRLERGVSIRRDGRQIVSADATAYLTEDEEQLTRLELRGGSAVTIEAPAPGVLQVLSGRDLDLDYGANGASLEHAHADGNGALQFAGASGRPGRRLAASVLDVGLGPDGTTPVALTGRGAVRLTIPRDGTTPARSIEADGVTGAGEAGRGITSAQFTGRVTYREGGEAGRVVTAGQLDTTLDPKSGAIEDARFTREVHVTDAVMQAYGAAARYRVGEGLVELTGAEPATPVPNVVNGDIDVRATRIDVTLEGPRLHATGNVKSVVKPAEGGARATRMPAMLDAHEPVTVTGDELQYDGVRSLAVYTGRAWLWQGDTSVKGDKLTLDSAGGDLSASGSVTTTTVLDEKGEGGTVRPVTSIATSKTFVYQEVKRLATYSGDAHVSGPARDLTAETVELFLAESGDAADRVEAYESITLRERQRKTTGARMTYTAADERYLVTGGPATIVDECGRETVGQRISFLRTSDTVTVDGGTQRAVTRGGNCTGP